MNDEEKVFVEVSLGENGNQNRKISYYDSDALIIDEHVLPTFEQAMKGFGFILDGQHLEIVDDVSEK